MLNLAVGMLTMTLIRLLVSTSIWIFSIPLVTPGLYITTPQRGAILEGIVEIRGSVPVENFQTAEIAYAYQDDSSATWFVVERLKFAIQDEVLVNWDTTTITDGTYQLRLKVTQKNGNNLEVIVNDLHVANYTHDGSTAISPTQVISPQAPIVGSTERSYPTNLAPNPASIKPEQIKTSLVIGLIAGVLSLLIIGFFVLVNISRRRR